MILRGCESSNLKIYLAGVGSAKTTEPATFLFSGERMQNVDSLLKAWKTKATYLSDPDKATAIPEFALIVQAGRDAVPVLTKELKSNPHVSIFSMLEEITGHDPVDPADYGNVDRMACAWLGYLDPIQAGDIVKLNHLLSTVHGSICEVVAVNADAGLAFVRFIDEPFLSSWQFIKFLEKQDWRAAEKHST